MTAESLVEIDRAEPVQSPAGRRHRRPDRRYRHRGRPVLAFQPRPARPQDAGRLPAGHRLAALRLRRPPARRICPREARVRAGRGHAQARARGLRRRRGPALLHPSRHRLRRRPACRGRQSLQPRQAAGRRLGHHPAGGQELPADQPGHPGAQDPRGHPGLPHRGHLLEGAHPRALSQRDLSRLGQLRRGPGRHQLFRPLAGRAHAVGDRLSRGAPQGAQPLQHRAQRERGLRPARLRAGPHARGRLHHLGRDAAGQDREAAAAPPRQHRGRAGRLLRRGSPPQSSGRLRREGPLRGWPHRQHHARSRHPGGRRQGAARGPDLLRPPPRLARPLRQDRRHVGVGGGIRPHRPAPAAQRAARLAARRGHQGRSSVDKHRRPARRRRQRRRWCGHRHLGDGDRALRRDDLGAADAGKPDGRRRPGPSRQRRQRGRRDRGREDRQAWTAPTPSPIRRRPMRCARCPMSRAAWW